MRAKTKRSRGISLVEVVIVLAISALLIGIAIGTFGQRRKVATQDAINQLVSSIQTVKSEAQKGLGPTTPAGTTAIQTSPSGTTLYGEAAQFVNNCNGGSQSCIVVFKLMRDPSGNISSYESYTIPLKEGLSFVFSSGSCTTTYNTCYTQGGSPSQIAGGTSPMIVFLNGSGAGYYFGDSTSGNFSGSATNQNSYNSQGSLQLAVSNGDPAATVQYLVNADLSGSGDITSKAYTP